MCSKHWRALGSGGSREVISWSRGGHGLGLLVILWSSSEGQDQEKCLIDIFKLDLGDRTCGCLSEFKKIKNKLLLCTFSSWIPQKVVWILTSKLVKESVSVSKLSERMNCSTDNTGERAASLDQYKHAGLFG